MGRGKSWTKDEDAFLIEFYKDNSVKTIYKKYLPNRTIPSITTRIRDLKKKGYNIKAEIRGEWKRKQRVCTKCGNIFYYKKSNQKRKMCFDCFAQWTPRNYKKAITKCKHCSKDIVHNENIKKVFCDRNCKYEYYIHEYTYNPEKYLHLKNKGYVNIFKKDIIECELCGYMKHPEILEIHHINGKTDNLKILKICPNCHKSIHRNLITI